MPVLYAQGSSWPSRYIEPVTLLANISALCAMQAYVHRLLFSSAWFVKTLLPCFMQPERGAQRRSGDCFRVMQLSGLLSDSSHVQVVSSPNVSHLGEQVLVWIMAMRK